MRHKSVNTPLSHEWLVGGLQDGGRGTHVTHFVQLYPQPLYTASQVHTTCCSWDEGVLTDVCLTGVLTDLCLTRYFEAPVRGGQGQEVSHRDIGRRIKANSHVACHAHAIPLPCHAANSLECVFPI